VYPTAGKKAGEKPALMMYEMLQLPPGCTRDYRDGMDTASFETFDAICDIIRVNAHDLARATNVTN
jgi:hypothetical protein